ncbi:MAG: hypothetical protein IANPNBLG_01390 [Bryobacteraceae bacterium]|nr:hypothetical protein [Bryobacteraceae bacterium]
MIRTLQEVFNRAVENLYFQVTTYLPPLLVAILILLVAYALARSIRWLLLHAFKGLAADRFLEESGLSSLFARAGRLRAAALLATFVYWAIFVIAALTALNVFDTKLTSQIVEGTVFLFPKLLTAGAILLAGVWLGHYFGRSVLLWACNEELPRPRLLASLTRTVIVFVAVVVAADALNFARNVFLASFIILTGAAALAASLAFGLGGRRAFEDYLERRSHSRAETGKSFFQHL